MREREKGKGREQGKGRSKARRERGWSETDLPLGTAQFQFILFNLIKLCDQ